MTEFIVSFGGHLCIFSGHQGTQKLIRCLSLQIVITTWVSILGLILIESIIVRHTKGDNHLRRIKHFFTSGCFVIGIEHFLVMFPSAMLIAKIATTRYGTVIELPSVLFACGCGTLLFVILCHRKIPFLLGPSFAYIGFVSYQVARINDANDLSHIRSTIYYGYILAGIILLVLGWLYRFKITKSIIKTLFPSTVMGPAISLIGLELANMAARDSGFTGDDKTAKVLSLVTLFCIIVFSLLRHHFLQNASVLIGVSFGCIIAIAMGAYQLPTIDSVVITIPKLYILSIAEPPENLFTLALSVFPCALIAFVESLGRIAVFEGMVKRDGINVKEKEINHSISIHAVSNIVTSAVNMMPSAIYAENLAIMNLHSAELSTKRPKEKDEDDVINQLYSSYSVFPYFTASVISIVVALFGGLQVLFSSIPLAILGGMELFVFGLIAAPGIQILVEQQVNYKKISNQIITASVLFAGISDISITYKSLVLHGMSLGLTIGVIVNIISLILGRFGYLNERFLLVEIIDEISNVFDKELNIIAFDSNKQQIINKRIKNTDIEEYIRRTDINKLLNNAYMITFNDQITRKEIQIIQETGRIDLKVNLPIRYSNRIINDHENMTILDNGNRTKTIIIDEYVSKTMLIDILKNAV